MPRAIKLEDFGIVRPYQAEFLNKHFAECLDMFEEQYAKQGGQISSLAYEFERKDFAKLVAKSILDDVAVNLDELSFIQTDVQFYSPSLQKRVDVGTSYDRNHVYTEDLRVEDYGHVWSNQSGALNKHLAVILKGFDREFQKSCGPLGSPNHQLHREACAKSFSKWVIDHYRDNPGDIESLRTNFEYDVEDADRVIRLYTETNFNVKMDKNTERHETVSGPV